MSQGGYIDLQNSNPQVPTQFDTEGNSAIPTNNVLKIIGGPGIETDGSGNIININLDISQAGYVVFDGTATFTGNTFQEGNGITITNANGISGNTTIASNSILSNTNGTVYYDGSILRTINPGTSTQVLTSNGNSYAHSFQSIPSISTSTYFSAYLSSTQNNVTGDGTAYSIIFDTVTANQGSAYNASTGVFTAPSTGLYHFDACTYFQINGVGTIGFVTALIATSISLQNNLNLPSQQQTGCNVSGLISMSAGDTCYVSAIGAFGTKTTNITAGGVVGSGKNTFFCGYRVA